ncbi:MAG: HAMP domain-containing histidine kinase [Lachnospiraceae bacterium]|nr:HAMP domain-containing histidine kinase [Lachnospiraceae bacterium]
MMKNTEKKRFNKKGLIIKRLIIQTLIVTLIFGTGTLIYLKSDYRNWADDYYRYIEEKNKDLIIKLQEYETKDEITADFKNYEDLLLASSSEMPEPRGLYIKMTDRKTGEVLADSKEKCFFILPKESGGFADDTNNPALLYESDDEYLLKWMKDTREEYLSIADEGDENHLYYQVNKYCVKDNTFYPLEMVAYYRPGYTDVNTVVTDKDKYETWGPIFYTRDYDNIEGIDEMEVIENKDNEGAVYLSGGIYDVSDFPEAGKGNPDYDVSYGESHTYEFPILVNRYIEKPRYFFKDVNTMIIIRNPFMLSKSENGEIVVKNYVLESYFKSNYWTEEQNIFTRKIILALYAFTLLLSAAISVVISLIQISKREKEEFRKTLTDSISHDLKSPLTALRGYAESLKENLNEDKKEIYADAILESADYMDRLINGNFELLKLKEKKYVERKENVNLVGMTENLFEKYIPLLEERNVKFEVTGSFEKKANKDLMEKALENLVSNSVKYVNDSGEIKVEGNKKGFVISNSVDSLPDKKPDKLWESFIKGDDARSNEKGSGIGLAIAKSIFDLHKIKATIEFKDGKEKRFEVYINQI